MQVPAVTDRWYRDRAALSLIVLGYLPWLAGLNLAWEAAQLPLYTVWRHASAPYLVFTVVHCTLGDLAIGLSALFIALILTRSPAVARWRLGRVTALTVAIGIGYTGLSEWMNTAARNWTYADLMPVVRLLGVEIGVSPLAQWMVIPPAALYLARWRRFTSGSRRTG
jgi:hypothetical protein